MIYIILSAYMVSSFVIYAGWDLGKKYLVWIGVASICITTYLINMLLEK